MRRLVLPIVALSALLIFVAACGGGDGNGGGDGDGGEEPAVPFAESCQKTDEKQFAAPPPRIIDTGKQYIATISTQKGDIVLELFSDTPITTNNFVFLACKGYYDGLTFHRVEPNFVIQGGDPTGTGGGGPGYSIPDEDDGDHQMDQGVISMAKAGPNTTGSQFFIVIGPRENAEHLDPDFTVFGRVTAGMDVAEQIAIGDSFATIVIEER